MGRLKTITRRTLLIGSAAIAGGVSTNFNTYINLLLTKTTSDNEQ